MDNTINVLVAIDREARDLIKAKKLLRDTVKIDMAREKEEMNASYLDRAGKRIIRMREQSKQRNDESFEKVKQMYTRAEEEIEAYYDKNRETWVKQIVGNIINPT